MAAHAAQNGTTKVSELDGAPPDSTGETDVTDEDVWPGGGNFDCEGNAFPTQ